VARPETLKAATARVGEGDFDVRAKVAARRSSSRSRPGFNAMAQRVQALLQSHRDLEQGVAHELRTPLAQLKFDLELARTSASSEDREERFGDGEGRGGPEKLVSELLGPRQPAARRPHTAPKPIPAEQHRSTKVLRAANEGDARHRAGRSRSRGPRNLPEQPHLRFEVPIARAHQHPAQTRCVTQPIEGSR
jgi:signal transduction histidine kinase